MKRFNAKVGTGTEGEEAGVIVEGADFWMAPDGEEPTSLKTVMEKALARGFSRRDLLLAAGGGTAGLLATALLSDPAHAGTRERLRQIASRGVNGITAAATNTLSNLQLPVWGDGVKFDQPQYYTTIQAGRRLSINKTVQSADIDGDGQDELIARAPDNDLHGAGMQIWKYNASGAWQQMPGIPLWTDAAGWNQPQYYETIQCADIDGDGIAELMGRGPDGVEAFKYPPGAGTWNQLPTNGNFSDSHQWNFPQYY